MKDLDAQLDAMNDQEVLDTLRMVLDSTSYEENSYSTMMRDILKRSPVSLSSKQRNAIESHLTFNKNIWY